MPKGSRGGSKSGSIGGSIGAKGTGVEITINNKKRQFFVSDTGALVEMSVSSGGQQKTGALTVKEFVKRAIDSGKGTFLSKTEVKKRQKKIDEQREERSKIDYEMGTGTSWENKNNRKAARISRLQSRRRRN